VNGGANGGRAVPISQIPVISSSIAIRGIKPHREQRVLG
jgi:hypothetical protein